MSISKIHHPIFSLTTILAATHCLGSPLLPRDEGTFVLSVNSAALETPKTSSSSIISGWSDPTAIVFLVAIASLVLTVPMFVYIWMRRRRLHAARRRGEREEEGERKGSIPLVSEVQLIARNEVVEEAGKMEARKEEVKVEVEVEVERKEAPVRKMKKGSVRFVRPVQVSVKPTRAVEIMVKPAKVVFRDPTWEKLKS
ncbi:hypothetical protein Q9L58_007379 [Maublancomyces gigas]|uniref:Transmembrane protein n=1 Tax=Discina gigas TaxID=1032678 RepID=A0ABR3GCS6_9PEZI